MSKLTSMFYAMIFLGLLTNCDKLGENSAPEKQKEYVEVEFIGIVDATNDSDNLLDGSVSIGSVISGSYRMKINAEKHKYSQPNSGTYFRAIGKGDLQLLVGEFSFSSSGYDPDTVMNQVTMKNGGTNADGLYDGWYVYSNYPETSSSNFTDQRLTIFLSLYDKTANALSSTELVSIPKLGDWGEARIGVSRFVTDETGTRSSLFIAGKITKILEK